MITDQQKIAILESWKMVVPIAETAADLFYRRLFELEPSYRRLFPEDLSEQKRKLVKMLAFIVKALDWPDDSWRSTVPEDEDLFLVVLALGRRHQVLYRIPEASYQTVGEALIWTLDLGLGKAFTAEVRDAWVHVYGLLAKTMRMGEMAIDRDADAEARTAASKLALRM